MTNNTPQPKEPSTIENIIIILVLITFMMVSLLSIADAVAHNRMEGKIDTINTIIAPTFTAPVSTSVAEISTATAARYYICSGIVIGGSTFGYKEPVKDPQKQYSIPDGNKVFIVQISKIYWDNVWYQAYLNNDMQRITWLKAEDVSSDCDLLSISTQVPPITTIEPIASAQG